MSRFRPWHLLLVLAALAVPLQAGALNEGEAPISMDVAATLDHCGVTDTGIVCKIDMTWSGIEEAASYTATVTGPGGVASEMGTVGTDPAGGSTSLWVPYEGDGIYSVVITAWGEEDEEGNKPKLQTQEAETRAEPDRGGEPGGDRPGEGTGQPAQPEQPANPEQPDPEPVPSEPEPAPEPEPEPEPAPEAPAEPEAETPAAPAPPAPASEPEPETSAAPAEPADRASSDETPAP